MQVGEQPVEPLCHYVMWQQFYQITGAEDLQGLLEEGGPPVEFLEVVVEVAGVGVEVAHFEEVEVVLQKWRDVLAVGDDLALDRPQHSQISYLHKHQHVQFSPRGFRDISGR
jgi:hypothetical protein